MKQKCDIMRTDKINVNEALSNLFVVVSNNGNSPKNHLRFCPRVPFLCAKSGKA